MLSFQSKKKVNRWADPQCSVNYENKIIYNCAQCTFLTSMNIFIDYCLFTCSFPYYLILFWLHFVWFFFKSLQVFFYKIFFTAVILLQKSKNGMGVYVTFQKLLERVAKTNPNNGISLD